MKRRTAPRGAAPLKGLAGGLETPGEQGLGPFADHRFARLSTGAARSLPLQQDVEGADQIGGGLHQGAVEVEGDGRSVEMRKAEGQGGTPVKCHRPFR